MDAQLKAKWVEELRLGRYQQVRGILEDCGSFCCLGVLLKIQGVDVENWRELQKESSVLPVQNGAGLTTTQMLTLAKLNDDGELSFPEIADYIEANIPADETDPVQS